MHIEALLDSKEILFLYLFNHEINPDEDDQKQLFQKSPKQYYYFKQCADADFYKVSINLVLNYEDAIN